MGQPPLIIIFMQRARLDIEIDGHPVFRFLIMLEDIAKTIGQSAAK
jgi:hypothetical protein